MASFLLERDDAVRTWPVMEREKKALCGSLCPRTARNRANEGEQSWAHGSGGFRLMGGQWDHALYAY